MKVVFVLMVASIAAGALGDSYSSMYDDVDIEEVLKNDRLYQKYYNCLANTGKCTPDGKELKEHLAEAIKTDCKKCNGTQQKKLAKFLKRLLDEKPDDYATLEKAYDPGHIFRKKHSS